MLVRPAHSYVFQSPHGTCLISRGDTVRWDRPAGLDASVVGVVAGFAISKNALRGRHREEREALVIMAIRLRPDAHLRALVTNVGGVDSQAKAAKADQWFDALTSRRVLRWSAEPDWVSVGLEGRGGPVFVRGEAAEREVYAGYLRHAREGSFA
jgi:hypothetical protein